MDGKDLDGYLPAEFGVLGPIHFAHAPRANRSKDLIGPKFVACRERHMRGSAKCTRSESGLCLNLWAGMLDRNLGGSPDSTWFLLRNPLVIQNPVVNGSRGHVNLTNNARPVQVSQRNAKS